MAAVVHLLKRGDPALALATIARQTAGGDAITVVLLHGVSAPALPAGVRVRRVPEDMSYADLLDTIFAADAVIAW